MLNKDDKKPIKIGLLAGFVASLCCIGPLILIILGIGGASTALAIGKQSPYFLALGVLILAAGLGFYYFRKSKKVCDECDVERFSWKKAVSIIVLACAAFLVVYYVLLYILVPWLAPIIYQNFYN
jgi:mercuric ion transport protein